MFESEWLNDQKVLPVDNRWKSTVPYLKRKGTNLWIVGGPSRGWKQNSSFEHCHTKIYKLLAAWAN